MFNGFLQQVLFELVQESAVLLELDLLNWTLLNEAVVMTFRLLLQHMFPPPPTEAKLAKNLSRI